MKTCFSFAFATIGSFTCDRATREHVDVVTSDNERESENRKIETNVRKERSDIQRTADSRKMTSINK